ncbi:hypothetical protein DIU36_13235 [Mucilaginibacter rubeus]|nr:hypothetical protein DIU36_13235 [Mucilaginibacter rubeus]
MIWSLGMLLKRASTIHTIKTAIKACQKELFAVVPIKRAVKNDMTATIHQGKKYPLANESISMMKNNMVLLFTG